MGRGEGSLVAEQGRMIHRLLGDLTRLEQRLRTLEGRVSRVESNLVGLVKTLSGGARSETQ